MKRRSGASKGYWPKLYRVAWGMVTVVVILGAASLFYPQYRKYVELQRREAELKLECRQEQAKIQRLLHDQEAMISDPAFVERIAREEFGLAKPGESVIKFIDDRPAGAP